MPTHARLVAGYCLLVLGACADLPTAPAGPVPDSAEQRDPLLDALQGREKGVQLSGGGERLVMRCYDAGIPSGQRPLVLIDGEARADGIESLLPLGAGAGSIRPEDMHSVAVIRAPEAVARFGEAARDGAILITTHARHRAPQP